MNESSFRVSQIVKSSMKNFPGINPKRLKLPEDPPCEACKGTGKIHWDDPTYGPCTCICYVCCDVFPIFANWTVKKPDR